MSSSPNVNYSTDDVKSDPRVIDRRRAQLLKDHSGCRFVHPLSPVVVDVLAGDGAIEPLPIISAQMKMK
jgi:hypothetical protein